MSLEQKLPLGFIILRCVKNKDHDNLWQECYDNIRKIHSEPIMIIDDNSNQDLLTQDKSLEGVTIIPSEYPGAGEFLPYYYFQKLHPFENAIILHDSMFLKKKIILPENLKMKFLWHFEMHWFDNPDQEVEYLKKFTASEDLIQFYFTERWYGCFGGCSMISFDFLNFLEKKYSLSVLKDHIRNRGHRMTIERIIAVLAFHEKAVNFETCSSYGDIFQHPYAYTLGFQAYQDLTFDLGMIKVWTGR